LSIIRQRQKPFFSTLEEIELDMLAGGAKKEDFPSEEVLTKPVVESIVVRPSAAAVADSLPKLSRKTGICIGDAPFVYISPGTFIMGSPEHEPGRGSDEMQHEVTLTRGYFIQTTPVTQEQWKEVMRANPSNFLQGGEDCPVEGVSWNDCQEFLRRVNNKGRYPYRLPTEAEWEYACRAGASTSFSNEEPGLDAIGWYCGNSGKKTHPVAAKQPNAWGLFDMHGNVCEWCQDWYGKYPLMPQRDPQEVTLSLGCVARGGSWLSESQNCRAASRFCYSPNLSSNFVGFRLVKEP
jgi:formylglycine-generating enzyme required for sulfatase activity